MAGRRRRGTAAGRGLAPVAEGLRVWGGYPGFVPG